MIITNGWPSQILVDTISQKNIVDELVSHIFQTYDLSVPPKDFGKINILDDPAFDDFISEIVEPSFNLWLVSCLGKKLSDFDDRSMKAWITGANNGYSMLNHNHSGAQLSSVFYIFNDNENAGGEIVFFDPRHNANRAYKSAWSNYFDPYRLKTPSYTYAVFPSFVHHQVTEFKGNIRLALPVDLYL
jgi:hypothetical protein